jgi:hypothetical protein
MPGKVLFEHMLRAKASSARQSEQRKHENENESFTASQ